MGTLWAHSSSVVEEEASENLCPPQGELQARLAHRLRLRRDEITQSLLARICSISDPRATEGADDALGLREAVSAALDFGLVTLEEARTHPIPTVLLEQARTAARNGVNLDTMLRRYLAGYTLLCDHLLLEAEREDNPNDQYVRGALRSQSAQLDRLLTVVTKTYMAEIAHRHASTEHRRAERVRRLLDGDLVDTADLGYELDGWHVGVMARGPSAPRAIRELAALHDRRLLLALPGGEIAWGWLGGRCPISAHDLSEGSAGSTGRGNGVSMAVGEPGEGVEGFRLTHRQAKVVLPVALRADRRIVTYSDFAIVASAWDDGILSKSLSRMFLAPLASGRGDGLGLLKTLQAYFAAGRNAASAASGLGVSRQTVNSRLRMIEEKIGRPLDACGPELETALRLWELGHPAALAGDLA